jgi:hypothetical protein
VLNIFSQLSGAAVADYRIWCDCFFTGSAVAEYRICILYPLHCAQLVSPWYIALDYNLSIFLSIAWCETGFALALCIEISSIYVLIFAPFSIGHCGIRSFTKFQPLLEHRGAVPDVCDSKRGGPGSYIARVR